ncbi:MAG TPA: hypothetical protein ACQGQF_00520 [Xylella fastidiosa subsp. pauca]
MENIQHNDLTQKFFESQHDAATPYPDLTGRDNSTQTNNNHTNATLESMVQRTRQQQTAVSQPGHIDVAVIRCCGIQSSTTMTQQPDTTRSPTQHAIAYISMDHVQPDNE